MSAKNDISEARSRNWLALGTLGFAASGIIVLALVAIVIDSKNAMTILNVVLPVIASWVGTILAFYFGRENFESANQQVRELVQRLTPEERAQTRVTAIMRRVADVTLFQIPKGKGDQDIALKELRTKFGGNVSRLPVTDADKKPKYMIHESRIDKYIADGGTENDTLAMFIAKLKDAGIEFGFNKGFAMVSEKATLAEAKRRTEEMAGCQDIFVTKEGTADEPLTGWISNVRMAKFLEA